MRAKRRSPEKYDILLAADFTRHGDLGFRLAQEIRAFSTRNRRVGLVQLRPPAPGGTITDEVVTCLRRGLARIVEPDQNIDATTLVLHGAATAVPAALPRLSDALNEVRFVAHTANDIDASFAFPIGPDRERRVHAASAALRDRSPRAVDPEIWYPVLPDSAWSAPSVEGRDAAILWIAGGPCPEVVADCTRIDAEHYVWPGTDVGPDAGPLPGVSLDRLVLGLDAMVVASAAPGMELPDTLVAAMLQAGRAVLMPRTLRDHYGRGPTYFSPSELPRLMKRVVARATAGAVSLPQVPPQFVSRCLNGPATVLLSRPVQSRGSRTGRAGAAERPMLCLAANGVGVGHLTRLVAIARRSPGRVVFASHAPAVGVIRDFGFPVEYIPSAAAVGGDFERWDVWFRSHLDHLLDAWDPAVVAYDGNHPSPGLIEAVGARRDCKLAWIRRGMWARTTSPHMKNARWCDLVIEPGELAAEIDTGITARRRAEAIRIDPVVLLDSSELLDRAAAATALGLNPARPAVLIQLGSGHNRDLLTLLDQIIGVLSKVAGLQIAVAEWVNGSVPLTLWPQVTVIRGFPISQHLRAFDFCISAAGYNSYHELIGFGVPTIFVANCHPSMDDQFGRAKFAQDKAAAFEISEDDLEDLPGLVDMLMQDSARRFLVSNCLALTRPNGAEAAASALAGVAAGSLGSRP